MSFGDIIEFSFINNFNSYFFLRKDMSSKFNNSKMTSANSGSCEEKPFRSIFVEKKTYLKYKDR
jgi:hypothetical protein